MSTKAKYQQTLQYLFSQLPMFQRQGPVAFKKDLKNIIRLSEILGHPEKAFRSIHIAGTNGKGSTSHIIAAMLQAHGFKVGLYTSPHYRDYRERVKVDGLLIPKEEVVEFVEKYKELFAEVMPSFFEWSVALAFYYFKKEKVDFAVIETGLGGRLDSTNILKPLLSVITNISFDHTKFLGDTLEKIAGEKAGIIKPDTPVVIGEKQIETTPVFERVSKENRAPISYASDRWKGDFVEEGLDFSVYNVYKDEKLVYPNLQVNLSGAYQLRNLITALEAIHQFDFHFNDFSLDEFMLRKGLKDLRFLTRFIGRWQLLGRSPAIICDSAHNPGGMALAMEQLNKIPHEQLHIVLGMVNDKEPEQLLVFLPKNARYYFAKPNIPRGLDAKELKEQAKAFNLIGRAYVSVKNALKAAKENAYPNDLIYVGGSTFVVAEIV